MRDGEFHLNVLKRLQNLEDSGSAQRSQLGDLEATVVHLEEEVDTLENKVSALETDIEALRNDLTRYE